MKKPINIIADFAIKSGFDKVEFFSTFKNYEVYVASNENESDITFTGYPIFILYNDEVRFSTESETLEIMNISPSSNTSGEVL